MSAMIDKLAMYFEYSFVRYALIVGIFVSLCSSLLGVTLVLKRFSFIGDGLSHVAFGAISVSAVVGLTNNMFIVLPVTVLCAVLLLRSGVNARVRGDAAIAMVSTGALGTGYLIMNLFSMSSNINGDVCTTLFGSGSILTLDIAEVWLCVVLSATVIILFFVFYNSFFAVTFDENFARAIGIRTSACNLFLAVITAVIVVLAMNLVGSLLVSALLVFPALSAMRLFVSFKSVTLFSALLSVVCTMIGIIAAILFSLPVGPAIVVTDIAAYGVCCGISALKK